MVSTTTTDYMLCVLELSRKYELVIKKLATKDQLSHIQSEIRRVLHAELYPTEFTAPPTEQSLTFDTDKDLEGYMKLSCEEILVDIIGASDQSLIPGMAPFQDVSSTYTMWDKDKKAKAFFEQESPSRQPTDVS